MKPLAEQLTLERMIYGGQAIGQLESGKKALVWGGLPGETVEIQITKKKSSYVEGVVTNVLTSSDERVEPKDSDSYLSTSPWQIMTFEAEQHYKAALIEEAFELHDIVLPQPITVYSDGKEWGYRNKIEFSFWYDTESDKLDLAFFRRGTHGKIVVDGTSLAPDCINTTAREIVSVLNAHQLGGRDLKTLLIRCDAAGNVAWQLYVKNDKFEAEEILAECLVQAPAVCGEIIYSDPKSPASVITKRLARSSTDTLNDTLQGTTFNYATEGFFQINLPVYAQALEDMRKWVEPDKPTVDMYSGVGTIGLTIGGDNVTLVELNEYAVQEMERNIVQLKKIGKAIPVLAASEKALDYITSDATIIVDPPRAGLHEDVIDQLLEAAPNRIVYLSCNPATQARDVMRLAEAYGIRHHQGYNFFPRTPHIEHLVILDKK